MVIKVRVVGCAGKESCERVSAIPGEVEMGDIRADGAPFVLEN